MPTPDYNSRIGRDQCVRLAGMTLNQFANYHTRLQLPFDRYHDDEKSRIEYTYRKAVQLAVFYHLMTENGIPAAAAQTIAANLGPDAARSGFDDWLQNALEGPLDLWIVARTDWSETEGTLLATGREFGPIHAAIERACVGGNVLRLISTNISLAARLVLKRLDDITEQ